MTKNQVQIMHTSEARPEEDRVDSTGHWELVNI